MPLGFVAGGLTLSRITNDARVSTFRVVIVVSLVIVAVVVAANLVGRALWRLGVRSRSWFA